MRRKGNCRTVGQTAHLQTGIGHKLHTAVFLPPLIYKDRCSQGQQQTGRHSITHHPAKTYRTVQAHTAAPHPESLMPVQAPFLIIMDNKIQLSFFLLSVHILFFFSIRRRKKENPLSEKQKLSEKKVINAFRISTQTF